MPGLLHGFWGFKLRSLYLNCKYSDNRAFTPDPLTLGLGQVTQQLELPLTLLQLLTQVLKGKCLVHELSKNVQLQLLSSQGEDWST